VFDVVWIRGTERGVGENGGGDGDAVLVEECLDWIIGVG
jgi:hypothetical protein